jgi:isopenicillin N synthase-like dioxygenase
MSTPEIPVLDLAPYRAGEPGAVARLGAEMRHACETIGFYFVEGHGVHLDLVHETFAAVARFHALPLDAKMALKANEHNIGYMPMKGSVTRSSQVNQNTMPNLNESFFVKRDLTLDHPDVVSGKRFRGANQWPRNVPGFRQTIVEYCGALEALALSLMPIYAAALDLSEGFFDAPFAEPQYALRMAHYPPEANLQDNEFGSAPHTDSGIMTILAPSELPGLEIKAQSGEWFAPPTVAGRFLVNTGDMMHRWTNERFLSTPHRVIHRAGGERYAIPFFFDCTIDYVMECLPTCQGPDNPPRYPPTTYAQYMEWFAGQNYDHVRDRLGPSAKRADAAR